MLLIGDALILIGLIDHIVILHSGLIAICPDNLAIFQFSIFGIFSFQFFEDLEKIILLLLVEILIYLRRKNQNTFSSTLVVKYGNLVFQFCCNIAKEC